jgi:hypothetical protein
VARRSSLLLVVALALFTVACDDGSTDTTTENAGSDPTTTAELPGAHRATGGMDPALDWVFAGSISGALRQIVPWSDGFAALHYPDGDHPWPDSARRELWCSGDGIDWEPAQVPAAFEHVYLLAGHAGDLFALTGNTSDLTAPQTLWRRTSGSPWEQVLSNVLLHHIAIGANRVIAYQEGPFDVLAVYDATTLEQVDFEGILDLERAEQVPGPDRIPEFASGALIGLDDGFLARVDWARTTSGTTERVTWLLHSADGTSWTVHPADSTDHVDVGNGRSAAPTFNGLNLLTTDRGAPSFLDNPLLIDRWQQLPSDTDRSAASSWVTDTGIDLRATAPATIDNVSATEHGFFDIPRGAIRHSLDGVTWQLLDAPRTWSVVVDLVDHGARGLAEATILDSTDELIAVGVHGTKEPYVGLVEPTTEIWVTA